MSSIDLNIFDPSKYKKFLENEFTIIDKDRNEVPFVLNRAQDDFIDNVTYLNNVLKNRKQGISSVSLGIAATKFITGENERCASVSFIKDSALQQLQRAKHFIQSYERNNNVKLPLKYNSKNEMVLESTGKYRKYYTNTLRVGTAKSDSFGRGDDITFLHVTEAAHADDLPKLLSGIGEAVTNNAITILETTANGFNQYKTHWDMGGDILGLEHMAGDNGYANFFYDPFWTYDKTYVEARRATLGRLGAQEYPYNAQEAFLTSGDPYFDFQSMQYYFEQSSKHKVMA